VHVEADVFIGWAVFGALLTAAVCWLHLASLVWGVLVEILPWPCRLTPAENWRCGHAGLTTYGGGFLLHLDALVYPDVLPGLLTIEVPSLCAYSISDSTTARFRHRHVAGW
jgi:hypothetical protein